MHEPDPVLRTTAAAALTEVEPPPADAGFQLLESEDPLVRAVAVELVPVDARGLTALVKLLEGEEDHEVRSAVWAALDERVPDARSVGAARAALVARLSEAPEKDFGPAAVHVEALAQRLTVRDLHVRRAAVPDEARVSVGDGGSAAIALRAADLAEVDRIRGAVVQTDHGTFVMGLDPGVAPLAVASFAALAEAHWFDGLVFHRVVPGFVVQTGCPRGDGWGGPGYELADEDSERPFDHGAVGMARSDRDTGGSQWFVT
ncbi:MAG: peptidylprolyl isomerase, partial [Myxococcales bacterium]|nr:peptidylprolyl isomerase [Myxococcales bacterium]